MPAFEIGAIVRVPFPYVEKDRRHHRPALVISKPLGPDGSLVWVLMITAAENAGWPGDVPVGGPPEATGLPIPSIVRTAKIATIESASASLIGTLPLQAMKKVREHLIRSGWK